MDALTILERKRLRVGDRIPGWNFPLSLTRDLKVDEFVAKPVVLIFLREPNSPYAQNIFLRFRDLHANFLKINANVIGISRAEISDLRRIAQEYALPFPLAADPTGLIGKTYGINGQGTVIVDANQRIVRILHRTSDHDARRALELICSMAPIWSSQ